MTISKMCSSGDGVIAFIYQYICQNEWKKASGILIKMFIFIVEQDSVSFGFFNGLKIESKDTQTNQSLCFYYSPCLLTALGRL